MVLNDSKKQNLLYRENLSLRKKVSLSMVFVYVFIGLPVWYHLTKIDQFDLEPLIEKEKLKTPYLFKSNNVNGKPEFLQEISLKIPVNLNLTNTYYKFPDLLQSTQNELDEKLGRYRNEYGFNNINLGIELKEVDDKPAEYFYESNEYLVQIEHESYMGNSISLYEKLEIAVQYEDRSVYENFLPSLISTSILNHFFFEEIDEGNEFDRVLNLEEGFETLVYTPKIKISLNLILNKNMLADWSLNDPSQSQVFEKLLLPFFTLFEGVYKFDIESNIIYNEDLNLEVWNGVANNIDDLQSQLDISSLSNNAFVDGIEEKVLNFVVLFPENKNLKLNNTKEEAAQEAFLSYNLPSWGSVFIYKDLISELGTELDSIYLKDSLLEPLVYKFLKQIFPLLTASDGKDEQVVFSITKFVKKAILSNIYRTNKNIKAVYDMIHSLPVVTDESLNDLIPEEYQPYLGEFMNKFFPSLSIPQRINNQLNEVVMKRDQLLNRFNSTGNTNDKFKEYLEDSFSFFKLSEETFFDHNMVMGNYKSIKHIIAVYLPLLGPVCSLTIGGAIRLLKKPKQDPLQSNIKKNQ